MESYQINELLYLSRYLGGRGLKSLEQTYKETKVKSAVKILASNDPRIKIVSKFHQQCIKNKRVSIYKDATEYAREMNIVFEINGDTYKMMDNQTHVEIKNIRQLNNILRKKRNIRYLEIIENYSWQGKIFLSRKRDDTVNEGCYNWLKRWKDAPTDVIREIYNLYTQTLQTKTFSVMRGVEQTDNLCRLCKIKPESVLHILNNCGVLAKYSYTRRHNQVLKCFFFEVLKKFSLIDKVPPWFTSKEVKPFYDNKDVSLWWDVPEFTGASEELHERNAKRPDGKLKMKKEKKIFLIEMSCPWLDKRNEKYTLKIDKYRDIISNIKREEPEYTVDQITLIIDSLGGYSKNLHENIYKVIKDTRVIKSIILRMQKTVLSESVHIARRFKLGK